MDEFSFSNYCRVVVKVSSSVLFDEDLRGLRLSWFYSFVEDIVSLFRRGTEIIIVSSGAIALGKPALPNRNFKNLTVRRSLASIGQIALMAQYHSALRHYNISAAQILFSLKDSYDSVYSRNLSDTIEILLENGSIPVVNENDVIAPISFVMRDNDYLSAFIAEAVNAELLVLLSDVAGLHDKDPKRYPEAKCLKEVKKLGEEHFLMLGSSKSVHGTGGMKSKLSAAEIAVNSGCNVIIASGKKLHPLLSIEESQEFTFFHQHLDEKRSTVPGEGKNMNKMGYVLNRSGMLSLTHKADIEISDIIHVVGEFNAKELVSLYDSKEKLIGIGVSEKSSHASTVLINSIDSINLNFGVLWDSRVIFNQTIKLYNPVL